MISRSLDFGCLAQPRVAANCDTQRCNGVATLSSTSVYNSHRCGTNFRVAYATTLPHQILRGPFPLFRKMPNYAGRLLLVSATAAAALPVARSKAVAVEAVAEPGARSRRSCRVQGVFGFGEFWERTGSPCVLLWWPKYWY